MDEQTTSHILTLAKQLASAQSVVKLLMERATRINARAYLVLEYIAAHPNTTQLEVAESLGLGKLPNAHYPVKILVSNELIERGDDIHIDGRFVHYRITAKGERMLQETRRNAAAGILSAIQTDEFRSLRETLLSPVISDLITPF